MKTSNTLMFINLSKTIDGILFIAPLPVFLYCMPAFEQSVEFGYFYLSSSIAFLLATYASIRIKLPTLRYGYVKQASNASSVKKGSNILLVGLYTLAFIFIFSLSSLSLYKIALVASGQVTSLYTITTKLQVTGDTSFVSRIFTANMPSGMSIGIIFATLTSIKLIDFSLLFKPRNLIVIICFLTSILNILSSGGVTSLVAIIQILAFVLIAPVYSFITKLIKSLKVSLQSAGNYFVLVVAMGFTVYLVNLYSQLKKLDGILDVIGNYFEQVYGYQYDIYNYVNQVGTSGSGGLGSLFPIQLQAFQSDALSLFKLHLDPVLQKGVWFGMTGRQLLEFGSEFQPLVMFFSTISYFLILRFVAKALLPSNFASMVWFFLVFGSLISCWTSDPMTGIPVAFFVIVGNALIVRILLASQPYSSSYVR